MLAVAKVSSLCVAAMLFFTGTAHAQSFAPAGASASAALKAAAAPVEEAATMAVMLPTRHGAIQVITYSHNNPQQVMMVPLVEEGEIVGVKIGNPQEHYVVTAQPQGLLTLRLPAGAVTLAGECLISNNEGLPLFEVQAGTTDAEGAPDPATGAFKLNVPEPVAAAAEPEAEVAAAGEAPATPSGPAADAADERIQNVFQANKPKPKTEEKP